MPKNHEFDDLPEIMSAEDARRFLKVSKLTARYYLQSGLLKCEFTGKQTRCYRIKKTDFISFYRRYTACHDFFIPPEGWYGSEGRMMLKDAPFIKTPKKQETKMQRFYKQLLSKYPDLLSPDEISNITGYSPRAASRWCHDGKLKAIIMTPKIRVPKIYLLDFLLSDEYQNIRKKSKLHRQHLIKIRNL